MSNGAIYGTLENLEWLIAQLEGCKELADLTVHPKDILTIVKQAQTYVEMYEGLLD